jgi:hypothetical protein
MPYRFWLVCICALRRRGLIVEWQDELRRHKRELAILEMPADYLDAPVAVPSMMPSFFTLDEYEEFNAEFAQTVMNLEMTATKLKNYCQGWTRLTLEQQNRELIMALAERMAN